MTQSANDVISNWKLGATSTKYGNYGQYFVGLKSGTREFNAKWLNLAENDPNFALSQHNFIEDTHYGVLLNKLSASGMNMSGRGIAVQDMLWSTSVQFGGGKSIVKNAVQSEFGGGVKK